MDTQPQRTVKRRGMWAKLKNSLLSVLSMTLSCLLGSDDAIYRPMVKLKLKGSNTSDTFLYDSGAQVSR